MKKFLVAAGSALALSACGGAGGAVDADADGDGEVTQAEAQAASEQLSDQVKPEPGQYRATMNFVTAEFPGAPPEMVEMMSLASGQTNEFCMTQEMADAGYGEAMKENQDDSCTISRLKVDGGEMDMAMTCNPPQVGEVNISMTGTITPTRSEMNMISEGSFGPLGEGKMEMNIEQERIGDCSE